MSWFRRPLRNRRFIVVLGPKWASTSVDLMAFNYDDAITLARGKRWMRDVLSIHEITRY